MKLLYPIITLFLFNSCSFDNKSGIWKNNNEISNKKIVSVFKDFKKIKSSNEIFDKTVKVDREFKFKINNPSVSLSWKDKFYSPNNNLKNFKYNERNNIILKTKKLTKNQVDSYILYNNNNLIFSDIKGNIIVFSIAKNKFISKFNFYKKKYKNIKKSLNLIIDRNIIYASDNIGYIYAYDYVSNKILWAKNFKIPFRSNVKLFSNKIAISNQNNEFFILEKETGNLVKLIPTEETAINNLFINNISLSNKDIFFLNTYGSLYSINKENFNFNWFINLNKTLDLNLSDLFYGSEVLYYDDKIIVSSNDSFFILNSKNGSIIKKKNYSTDINFLINNNYIFLVSKNNYLISMSLKDGEIIYSHEINQKVGEYLNTKKKNLKVKNMMMINNNIFLFLENSYVIKFNLRGEINDVLKLPSYLRSNPIIIDNSLMYLNNKNKLLIVD